MFSSLRSVGDGESLVILQEVYTWFHSEWASQRFALPAAGRAEISPFYRNQLQATQSAWKRAESHLSAARFVGRTERQFSWQITTTKLILKYFTHKKDFRNHQKRLQPNRTFTKQKHPPSEKWTLRRNSIEPKNLDKLVQNICRWKLT